MIREYHVTWEIDVDAENEEDAARQALEMQRDPESSATVFDVYAYPDGKVKMIDVDAPPRHKPDASACDCYRCTGKTPKGEE